MASYNRKDFTYLSSDGKNHIAAYLFTPTEGAARAVVQILHGACDYIGRYGELISALTAAGYAVCGNDCLGHGRTARHSDDLGFFATPDGDDTVVTDAHKLTLQVRSQLKGAPVILLGHGMGSLAARLYAVSYYRDLDGMILLGTAHGRFVGLGRLIAHHLVRSQGESVRNDRFSRALLGRLGRRVGSDADSLEWLTRDDEAVAAYTVDPFCNFTLTNLAFFDLFSMLERVSAGSWARQYPKSLPTLIASGDADPIGDMGRGPRTVATRLKTAGATDVTLTLYEGARHELHHETCRERFLEDTVSWLNARF